MKNDGNRALGPVYVQDIFPPETEYIRSSMRPSEISEASCQWTLVSLGIGQSSSIDLVLNATADQAGLVNWALAGGNYDGGMVKAENYSALQGGWLECCPSKLSAAKTARIDAADPTLIHYRISLRNRESYDMAVTIKDELPERISFVNSTTSPAQLRYSALTWNIANLEPGEVQSIDYLAKAYWSGIFTLFLLISKPGPMTAHIYSQRIFPLRSICQVWSRPTQDGTGNRPPALTSIAPLWVGERTGYHASPARQHRQLR